MQRIASVLLLLVAVNATRFTPPKGSFLGMEGVTGEKEPVDKKEPVKPSMAAPKSVGSLADFYQHDSWNFGMPRGSVHFAAGRLGANPHPPIDEEGYKKDWLTEHRSEPYPKEAEGKMHHPDYNTAPKRSAASGSATPLGSLLLLPLLLCFAK